MNARAGGAGHGHEYIVIQALAYAYYEDEPGPRSAAKLLSKDEAWRVAANIARPPDLLKSNTN
jgi:hypothetical protein